MRFARPFGAPTRPLARRRVVSTQRYAVEFGLGVAHVCVPAGWAKCATLTSVGAGLIGMSAGAQTSWPRPDGTERKLRIVQVNRTPLD